MQEGGSLHLLFLATFLVVLTPLMNVSESGSYNPASLTMIFCDSLLAFLGGIPNINAHKSIPKSKSNIKSYIYFNREMHLYNRQKTRCSGQTFFLSIFIFYF